MPAGKRCAQPPIKNSRTSLISGWQGSLLRQHCLIQVLEAKLKSFFTRLNTLISSERALVNNLLENVSPSFSSKPCSSMRRAIPEDAPKAKKKKKKKQKGLWGGFFLSFPFLSHSCPSGPPSNAHVACSRSWAINKGKSWEPSWRLLAWRLGLTFYRFAFPLMLI